MSDEVKTEVKKDAAPVVKKDAALSKTNEAKFKKAVKEEKSKTTYVMPNSKSKTKEFVTKTFKSSKKGIRKQTLLIVRKGK